MPPVLFFQNAVTLKQSSFFIVYLNYNLIYEAIFYFQSVFML